MQERLGREHGNVDVLADEMYNRLDEDVGLRCFANALEDGKDDLVLDLLGEARSSKDRRSELFAWGENMLKAFIRPRHGLVEKVLLRVR